MKLAIQEDGVVLLCKGKAVLSLAVSSEVKREKQMRLVFVYGKAAIVLSILMDRRGVRDRRRQSRACAWLSTREAVVVRHTQRLNAM